MVLVCICHYSGIKSACSFKINNNIIMTLHILQSNGFKVIFSLTPLKRLENITAIAPDPLSACIDGKLLY